MIGTMSLKSKPKRGFREWFGLALVAFALLALPDAVRGMIDMVRQTHWMAIFIPVWLGVGVAWNGWLIQRWWIGRA
jgi:hypothetical protein